MFVLLDWWSTFTTIFLSIFCEAFPFLALGSALAAAVHLFVPEKAIAKILGKKGIGRYLAASLAGLIFPICECAIVPLGGSLMRKKVPPSVVVSFMAAAPVVNPLVALSTLTAFKGEVSVVVVRMGLAFVVAALAGIFLHSIGIDRDSSMRPEQLAEQRPVQRPEQRSEHANARTHSHINSRTHSHTHTHAQTHAPTNSNRKSLGLFLSITAEELFSAGRFLAIGAAVAAIFQIIVPRSVLESVAPNPFAGTATMMSGAFLSALCSEADAFVAASFKNLLPVGALMGFMVYGPMLDIKNTLLLMATFKKKFVIAVIISITVITFCTVVGFSLV